MATCLLKTQRKKTVISEGWIWDPQQPWKSCFAPCKFLLLFVLFFKDRCLCFLVWSQALYVVMMFFTSGPSSSWVPRLQVCTPQPVYALLGIEPRASCTPHQASTRPTELLLQARSLQFWVPVSWMTNVEVFCTLPTVWLHCWFLSPSPKGEHEWTALADPLEPPVSFLRFVPFRTPTS